MRSYKSTVLYEGLGIKIVTYKRVSTQKQGKSGLGLGAQDVAIQYFARSRGARVIAE